MIKPLALERQELTVARLRVSNTCSYLKFRRLDIDAKCDVRIVDY